MAETSVAQPLSSVSSGLGAAQGSRPWGLQWLPSPLLNTLGSIFSWTSPLNFKESHYSWIIFPHEWIISRKYKKQSYDQMKYKSYDCCPWFKRSSNPHRTLSSRRAFNKSCESVRKIQKKKKKRDTDKKNAFEMDSQTVNTKHFKVIFYPSNYNCSLS